MKRQSSTILISAILLCINYSAFADSANPNNKYQDIINQAQQQANQQVQTMLQRNNILNVPGIKELNAQVAAVAKPKDDSSTTQSSSAPKAGQANNPWVNKTNPWANQPNPWAQQPATTATGSGQGGQQQTANPINVTVPPAANGQSVPNIFSPTGNNASSNNQAPAKNPYQ